MTQCHSRPSQLTSQAACFILSYFERIFCFFLVFLCFVEFKGCHVPPTIATCVQVQPPSSAQHQQFAAQLEATSDHPWGDKVLPWMRMSPAGCWQPQGSKLCPQGPAQPFPLDAHAHTAGAEVPVLPRPLLGTTGTQDSAPRTSRRRARGKADATFFPTRSKERSWK